MNEKPTKENTLYLPIKQTYFDQIMAGTKTEEFREIKHGITANRYLIKNSDGSYATDPEFTEPGKEYFVDDYNGGHFPFLPRQYKYLALAVGYAKERDTALVEVTGYRFLHDRVFNDLITFWQIAYRIGRIIEVHRKPRT